jgi:hypothetical protein
MFKADEESNANPWELEIMCRDRKFLKDVVKAILKEGQINFEVELLRFTGMNGDIDGRYSVFMWGVWFNNLNRITRSLKRIEKKFEKIPI